MIAYLEEKAMGGAGVVTYGEAIVHSATGKSHNKRTAADAFGVRQGMTEAARAIHNAGAFANTALPWRHVRRTRQRRRGCRYLQRRLWTKRDVHAGGRGKGDAKRFDLIRLSNPMERPQGCVRRPDSIWYRFMRRMDGCFHSSCLRCGTDAQMSSADPLKTGQDSS